MSIFSVLTDLAPQERSFPVGTKSINILWRNLITKLKFLRICIKRDVKNYTLCVLRISIVWKINFQKHDNTYRTEEKHFNAASLTYNQHNKMDRILKSICRPKIHLRTLWGYCNRILFIFLFRVWIIFYTERLGDKTCET